MSNIYIIIIDICLFCTKIYLVPYEMIIPLQLTVYLQQLPPPDVHEVAPDVQVQHIAFPLPVPALLAAEARHTPYAVVRAASLDAAVGVLDERPLEQVVRVVEVEMVYDAVPEHGGEYLPPLRVVHDEALRRLGPVAPVVQVVAELLHVLPEVLFPFPDVAPGGLVPLCAVECLIQVL